MHCQNLYFSMHQGLLYAPLTTIHTAEDKFVKKRNQNKYRKNDVIYKKLFLCSG